MHGEGRSRKKRKENLWGEKLLDHLPTATEKTKTQEKKKISRVERIAQGGEPCSKIKILEFQRNEKWGTFRTLDAKKRRFDHRGSLMG